MSIAIVVDRPTQFDAPFFRYVAQRSSHEALQVLFTDPRAGSPVRDPELDRDVDWGFPLRDGYRSVVRPSGAPMREWLEEQLGGGAASDRPDLLVVNGYARDEYRTAISWAGHRSIAVGLRIDSTTVDRNPLRRVAKRVLFRTYLRPRTHRFLATSTRTERYLEAFGVAPESIGRFPYAVDHERFRTQSDIARPRRRQERERLGIPDDAPVILAITKLSRRETPWDVVDPQVGPGDRWLVVGGDGPDRGEFERRARAVWGERFVALGYVPYPRLPTLYALSDVFLHAPREERWGVSVAEALACGVPVVAADTVGAGDDLILAGKNGAICGWGDPKSLGDALARALALETADVERASREPLATWGYEASSRYLLEATSRDGTATPRATTAGR